MPRVSALQHYLWSFLCLIGNIVQLEWISSQYFRYDISTNVQLFTPDFIDSPSLTMCIDMHRVIKWSNLSQEMRKNLLTQNGVSIFKLPNRTVESLHVNEIEGLLQKATHFEKMAITANIQNINTSYIFDITMDWKELFSVVGAYNSKEKRIATGESVLSIKEYVQDVRKCYQLESKGHLGRNLSYFAIRRMPVYHSLLSMALFSDKYVHQLRTILYGLNPLGENYYSDYSAFLLLPIERGILYTLTLNEYRTTLLPPPYETKCRNYSKEGVKSRGGCYESCLRVHSLKTWGRLHAHLAVFPQDKEKLMSFTEIMGQKRKDHEVMDEKCSAECQRRDCSSFLYVPRYITIADGRSNRGILSGIGQLVSLSPVTTTNCMKQVSLIQFLTDVSSSFGFWFGLSALGAIQIIINAMNIIIRRRKSRQASPQTHLIIMREQLHHCKQRCQVNDRRIRYLYAILKQPLDLL